jgi:hypothetical protein
MRKEKRLKILIFAAFAILWLTLPGRAEGEDVDLPAENWGTGTVSGNIVNITDGTSPPKTLDLMLHVWNQSVGEKPVIHIDSFEDGSFRFEEVDILPGDWLTVMTIYEGATYMGQPIEIKPGIESVDIELPIYESTNALSEVKIDQVQVFLFHDVEGLSISEVYVLSNLGDRTVVKSEEMDDGTPVTLKFTLQPGAENVSFSNDQGDRYILFPGGFADTAPLMPGIQNSGTMLSYIVPYENEISYSITQELPVGSVTFLTPVGSGLDLSGSGLVSSGIRPLRDGRTVNVYEWTNLLPGETLVVNVESIISITEASVSSPKEPGRKFFRSTVEIGFLAGGVTLGIGLVGAGIWLRRRSEPEVLEEDEVGEVAE